MQKRLKNTELNVSHNYDSNSSAAVLHINKSNTAGNSKRLYTSDLDEGVALATGAH